MYINFWYPIIRSEDLSQDKPERVKVLGVNLAAFRDQEGKARVISDTCTHRGASLAGAWQIPSSPRMVNGCVICPYHGWEFNGNGECVNIPSLGYGKPVPPRAKVDAYPVQEKYGIVFAFLGDLPEKERLPLYNVEEYGQPGWRANSVLVLDVPFGYERSVENGIDPAHNEFVHPTHGFSAFDRSTYKVNDYETTDNPQGWGFWFMHKFHSPPLPKEGPYGGAKTEVSDIYAGGGTYGPNTLITHITLAPPKGFRQYFFEQPVDADHTRIFFLNMRNFLLEPEKDGPIHARNKVIAQQDIEILSDVYPRTTPSNTKEVLINPGDKAVSAYRTWLQKFDEKGWRIDTEAFYAANGRTRAFAIPSPGRRTSGNWVLDPLPLLKNHDARKQVNWNVA